MSHFSHKKFLVTVAEVNGDDITLTDTEGKSYTVNEEHFQKYYIGVDLATGKDTTVTKKLSPFEEQYAKQLVGFGSLNQTEDDTYIRGQQELLKNKPI